MLLTATLLLRVMLALHLKEGPMMATAALWCNKLDPMFWLWMTVHYRLVAAMESG